MQQPTRGSRVYKCPPTSSYNLHWLPTAQTQPEASGMEASQGRLQGGKEQKLDLDR